MKPFRLFIRPVRSIPFVDHYSSISRQTSHQNIPSKHPINPSHQSIQSDSSYRSIDESYTKPCDQSIRSIHPISPSIDKAIKHPIHQVDTSHTIHNCVVFDLSRSMPSDIGSSNRTEIFFTIDLSIDPAIDVCINQR